MRSILDIDKIKEGLKRVGTGVIAGALVISLTGCGGEYVPPTNPGISYNEYSANEVETTAPENDFIIQDKEDVEDTQNYLEGDSFVQLINVPGEDFDLRVTYNVELDGEEKWTVTGDKQITMEIKTERLAEGTQVYIDNIHTDTFLCSHIKSMDNILQDTMDDRIHNAQMLGFPIDDDFSYVGINQIEGQNETFITGTFWGYRGYQSGEVEQRKYSEKDYLSNGAYASEVCSVIDLIIVKDGKTRCVSVPSKIKISVWPFYVDSYGNIYYYYLDDYGRVSYRSVSAEEYNAFLEKEEAKGLTK